MTSSRRCLLIALVGLAVLSPGFLSRDAAAQKNKPIDTDSPGGPAYRKEHTKDGMAERKNRKDKRMDEKMDEKMDKKMDKKDNNGSKK